MDIEKFTRDGAKYLCRHCKQGFFTKIEVEGCFDKHGQEAIDKVLEHEKLKKEQKKAKRRA